MPFLLALALVIALAPPALAETAPARFQIVAGEIAKADGAGTPTTVMVDGVTGQSWVLQQGEGVQWVPVPFSAQRPARLLPRLEGEPMLLRR